MAEHDAIGGDGAGLPHAEHHCLSRLGEYLIGTSGRGYGRSDMKIRYYFLDGETHPVNGRVLYRAGHWQDAIDRLRQGIEANRKRGTFHDWVFLAMAHHRLGQHAEAGGMLERARKARIRVVRRSLI